MPADSTTAKRRGRPFAKGFDPRRHQFTDEERSLAFINAMYSVYQRSGIVPLPRDFY